MSLAGKWLAAKRLSTAMSALVGGHAFPRRPVPDVALVRRHTRISLDLRSYLQTTLNEHSRLAQPRCDIGRVEAASIGADFRARCSVCDGVYPMAFGEPPDWREQGCCPQCGLNARLRFCVSLLTDIAARAPNPYIYVTEQATALYPLLRGMFKRTIGSEYVRDAPHRRMLQHVLDYHCGGPWRSRLLPRDLTRLEFADRRFDVIGSFDVLEHVADYLRALSEMHRVLKPGGWLVLSAPFIHDSATTLVRARVRADGSVEHLLPPEYHGEPVTEQGCLCFYHFGWDLLDRLRDAGFARVEYAHICSLELGFPGRVGAFLAQRASG